MPSSAGTPTCCSWIGWAICGSVMTLVTDDSTSKDASFTSPRVLSQAFRSPWTKNLAAQDGKQSFRAVKAYKWRDLKVADFRPPLVKLDHDSGEKSSAVKSCAADHV